MPSQSGWAECAGGCGKLMPGNAGSRPPTDIGGLQYKARACSKRCYDIARGVVRPESLPDRNCVICGTIFTPREDRAKYCSRECRNRRPRNDGPETLQRRRRRESQRQRTRFPEQCCPVCGVIYHPTNRPGRQKTCSRDCSRLLRSPRLPVPYVPQPAWMRRPAPVRSLPPLRPRWYAGLCAECGTPFIHKRRGQFCSDDCAKHTQRRLARHRRRALQVAAFVAPVYRRKIFERDKWHCKLCRKPVARTKQVPHPKAPVLDHIVPLASGGTHEPANVQCAHFLCNSLKSAGGGGEQLLLIG